MLLFDIHIVLQIEIFANLGALDAGGLQTVGLVPPAEARLKSWEQSGPCGPLHKSRPCRVALSCHQWPFLLSTVWALHWPFPTFNSLGATVGPSCHQQSEP